MKLWNWYCFFYLSFVKLGLPIKRPRVYFYHYLIAGNSGRAVFEIKIQKLKRNNQDLAKALSDQKIETNQW